MPIRNGLFVFAIFALSCLSGPTVLACSVPVFRYAIERWPADQYELVIFHEGELSSDNNVRLQGLRQATASADLKTNVTIRMIDVTEELDGDDRALWTLEGSPSAKKPRAMLIYPRHSRTPSPKAWSGAFDDAFVEKTLNSPVREKAAESLIQGDSAVWVFVGSGDAAADATALATLKSELEKLEETLELPEIAESDLKEVGLSEDDKAEIKIKFSVVELKRDDPKESVLLQSLLGVEPGLLPPEGESPQPMTFPIFGRGRALYALVGAGINADTIHDACSFLVGPCSCQVKEQNPGVDLLMSVPWDSKVQSTAIKEAEAPALQGFEEIIILDDIPLASQTGDSTTGDSTTGDSMTGDSMTASHANAAVEDRNSGDTDVAKSETGTAPALTVDRVDPAADTQTPPETMTSQASEISSVEGSAGTRDGTASTATSSEAAAVQQPGGSAQEPTPAETANLMRNTILAIVAGLAIAGLAAFVFRPRS